MVGVVRLRALADGRQVTISLPNSVSRLPEGVGHVLASEIPSLWKRSYKDWSLRTQRLYTTAEML